MSSFMCCPVTISDLADYISETAIREDGNLLFALNGNADPMSVYDILSGMNKAAIYKRYDKDKAEEMMDLGSKYVNRDDRTKKTPPAILKELDCFLYQCCEGDIPRTLLYQELESVHDNLKSEIIRNIPEYQNQAWC